MIALDLFCGAGGASVGIYKAGFDEVIGVDNVQQPNYPYHFILDDAIEFMEHGLDEFDFIWASPPCQAYTWAGAQHRNRGVEYPDLVDVTRQLLQESGKPYIIENVVGAPLINPVTLCGTMFPELKVFRHRVFESNVPLVVERKCAHAGHKAKSRRGDNGDFFTVVGHNTGTHAEWADAMRIDWMNKKELTQAIPPAYSEYLVKQVMEYVKNS